jgi:pimeloyl-ACP methyl ester carboxylesterase
MIPQISESGSFPETGQIHHNLKTSMKANISNIRFALLVTTTLLFGLAIQAQETKIVLKDCAGTWSGALKIQKTQLRLVMNITFNEADSAMATFDSPDQGVLDLPTSRLALVDDSIYVDADGFGGKFAGKLDSTLNSIAGSWMQGGMSFPLTMERQGKRVTINRPQEPKPPFPYHVIQVKFRNETAGIELAGTLTTPEAQGLAPAVVLISGSGMQNRDEELLGHKPFLLLADFLTRKGFAVLRYDDRGVGASKGDFSAATSLDFAKDAESALNFLKTRDEVDTAKIGFIGHSEGGLIAPIVASTRKDVAFIVMMAGPGLTGEQILLLQAALIAKSGGADEKTIKSNDKISRDIYSVLKKNSDNEKAAQKLRILIADYDKKNPDKKSDPATKEKENTAKIETLTSPWFRCFLTLDPQVYLSKVLCPLLAINGSLDLQVPPKENLEAIEKALIFGGNSSYVIEELPGLNHLFQTATTGNPNEYAKIEETISPGALELMSAWMKNNLK